MVYGNYKKRNKLFTLVYYADTIFALMLLMLDLLGLVRLQPILFPALACVIWTTSGVALVPTTVDILREPGKLDKLLGICVGATYLIAWLMMAADCLLACSERFGGLSTRGGLSYGVAEIALVVASCTFTGIALSRAKRREGAQAQKGV